jgi:hypothetical protein
MTYNKDQCPQHLDGERVKDDIDYGKFLGMKLIRTRSTNTQKE